MSSSTIEQVNIEEKVECPYCKCAFSNKDERNRHIALSGDCWAKANSDRAKADPLWLIESGKLTIKTKSGEKKKFILNSTQKRVLKIIKDRINSGKPIRLWVLKARQMGISTLIEAILFAYASQRVGINTCVLADDSKGSNYIFEMQKLFYDELESYLKPRIKQSNEKKLAFRTNSQVLIDTAENKNAGHKFTFYGIHLSEVSRFPYGVEVVMKGLCQTVPNLAGTMIIGETTANGFNEFHQRWCDAVDGKSEWEAVFLPWHEHEEYKLPLENDKLYPIDGMKFTSNIGKVKFLEEEIELQKKFNLTDEQLNWRRFYIVNYCNGILKDFYEQYPSTQEEAFISTGDSFFDKDGLNEQEIVEPKSIGNIVKFEGEYVFRENETGLFKIYEYPKKGEEYIIGGDTAEGLEHGDESTWVVVNNRTNETACVYNHRIPPDDFAQDGIILANFYNEAMIAPENKGYGYGVCQDIWNSYGNIYRNIKTKEGNEKETKDLGFNTNSSTRREMLAQLNEEIKEGSTDLKDKDLIRQCQTFVNVNGKPQAEKGKNDDLVIARAIAGQVRKQYPYVKKVSYEKERLVRITPEPGDLQNGGFGF